MASPDVAASTETGVAQTACLWIAALVALAGLAGSLMLSLGLGLKACPLCFYQRTFMMSLVAVLGIGLVAQAQVRLLAILAMPLAVAGLGVGLFHVSLEMRDKLECPAGLLGLGTAPQQSLVMFAILVILLGAALVLNRPRTINQGAAAVGGLVLGGLLAVASSISNPPMPPAPKEPYTKAPDICRPPFRPN
jgi:hypothetical protein